MAQKTINDILKIDSNGLQTATYREIVLILLDRYRQIYGYDIDLDPRTADGRFIYDVATIINTGVQVVTQMYNNLDPAKATGHFLDIIASLTNVVREGPTCSYAKVKLSSTKTVDGKYDKFPIPDSTNSDDYQLLDDGGNTWTWQDFKTGYVVAAKDNTSNISEATFKCDEYGPITTTGFKWMLLNSNTSNIEIELETISVGSEEESDSKLRSRRASVSNNGLTINESIKGNLLRISGVKDAWIYSYAGNVGENSEIYFNNESYTLTTHNTAILLRYDSVNKPNEGSIFESILNYLTPGVQTEINSEKIDGKITYTQYHEDLGTISNIYWYVCTGVTPTIQITITKNGNKYAGQTTTNLIAKALISYLNNLGINEKPNLGSMISVCALADPKYQSASTYFVTNVSFPDNDDQYPNKGTYFGYSNITAKLNDEGTIITITNA